MKLSMGIIGLCTMVLMGINMIFIMGHAHSASVAGAASVGLLCLVLYIGAAALSFTRLWISTILYWVSALVTLFVGASISNSDFYVWATIQAILGLICLLGAIVNRRTVKRAHA